MPLPTYGVPSAGNPAGGIKPSGAINTFGNWNFGGAPPPTASPANLSGAINSGGGGFNSGGGGGGPPQPGMIYSNGQWITPQPGVIYASGGGAGGGGGAINTHGNTGGSFNSGLGGDPPPTTPQGGAFTGDSFFRFAQEYGPPTAFGGGKGTYEKFVQYWQDNHPGVPMPTNEQWEAGDFDLPTGPGEASNWIRGWGTSPGHPGEGVSAAPDALWGQLDALQAAGINVPFDQSQMGPGGTFVGDTETQQQAMRDFLSGPLFSDLPFGLGLPLNLQMGQVMQQGARSDEATRMLQDLVRQGQSGPAGSLMDQTLQNYAQFSSPEQMDALRAQEENRARADTAASQNSALNTMRDLGITGQGRSASSPIAQMSNLGNRQLDDQMLSIAQQDESRRMGRFGQAGQLATQGAGAFQQLQAAPQQMLAARMEMAQNPALSSLIESLYQQSNLAQGQEFSRAQDPNPAALIGAGALSGAAAGTAVSPGWGTAIGGLAGAGMGAWQAYGN